MNKNSFTIVRELGNRRITITADYIARLDAYLCVSYIDGVPHDYESTEEVQNTMFQMISDAAVELAGENVLDRAGAEA